MTSVIFSVGAVMWIIVGVIAYAVGAIDDLKPYLSLALISVIAAKVYEND